MLQINQPLNITLTCEMLDEIEFDQLLEMIKTASAPVNAYHYATKAFELAKLDNNDNQIAIVELLLVDILIKNGAYQEALFKNIKVIEYFQKTRKLAQEATGWRYMAVIHGFWGNHTKQLEYNKKCLSILERLDLPQEELQVLNNLGDTFFNLGLYDKAKEVFEKNLANPNADLHIQVVSIKNIGKIYFRKKEFIKAKEVFNKVSVLADKHDMITASIASDHFLGKIYHELENNPLALEYLERAAKEFEKMGLQYKEYKFILEDLLKVLLALGKSEKAAIYFKKYTEVSQNISEEIKSQATKNIQFKLEINEIEQKRIILEAQNRSLKEANEKINSQQAALKSANQELTQFAYMVSHDIKQPIRTINNFSKLLAREVKDHLTKDAIEFIDIIDSSTKRITTFVEDILKYATATESKVELENVDCNEVLSQIKLNLEFQLKESEGQLLYEDLPRLEAHRSLMLQVFQNIISNGLKFRRTEVTPIVKVTGKETEENYYFEITDNGIGIREENQASVFKIFKQLNNKSEFEGSGIGLNTVLKILKKYNGSIDLESTFGEGTTFKITIPKVIVNEN